jgi:hypothetical protein
MSWLTRAAVVVCALGACTTTDDRPETLAYITETILAPNCGGAECHSASKRQSNYAFDTVEGTQAALTRSLAPGGGPALVRTCEMLPDPKITPCYEADAASYLLTVITNADQFGNRMPLDQPLANLDTVLIAHWIRDGAPGFTHP